MSPTKKKKKKVWSSATYQDMMARELAVVGLECNLEKRLSEPEKERERVQSPVGDGRRGKVEDVEVEKTLEKKRF
jgi:hypothetical protein